MGLQLLQQVMGGQLDVAIVQPDDHSDRQHVIAHRIDERSAELPVAGLRSQGPAESVNDAVEWLRDPPNLFHPKLPDLGVVAPQTKVVQGDTGQMPL